MADFYCHKNQCIAYPKAFLYTTLQIGIHRLRCIPAVLNSKSA